MTTLPKAAIALRRGKVIAFPTESFWALGTDATRPAAIRQVFRMKGRDKKPVALIAGSLAQVEKFFFMTSAEKALARTHWPGSLTILLRPKRAVATRALVPSSPFLSSRRGKREALIGVRVPRHSLARNLAAAAGVPITATSANVSGRRPTKSLPVLRRTFPDIVHLSGHCGRQRKPSTVIRVMRHQIEVIRSGAVQL